MGTIASIQNQLYSGKWLEGFLSGSALVLIHDSRLWQLLDSWLLNLDANTLKNCYHFCDGHSPPSPAPSAAKLAKRCEKPKLLKVTYLAAKKKTLILSAFNRPLNMVRFLLGLSPLSENSLNSASTQTEAIAGESP